MTEPKPKRARPKRLTASILVRMTPAEKEAIEIVADAAGMSVAEFVRRAILP